MVQHKPSLWIPCATRAHLWGVISKLGFCHQKPSICLHFFWCWLLKWSALIVLIAPVISTKESALYVEIFTGIKFQSIYLFIHPQNSQKSNSATFSSIKSYLVHPGTWIQKSGLPIPFITYSDHNLCKIFNVKALFNMLGGKYTKKYNNMPDSLIWVWSCSNPQK